ncbi:dihydroneopterin aldolase [Moraxella macacae 0408225]|uniref:7,8-dihydroneopterin aldolase n=1 Tax=Moraxella macacae 0408225 TaxID=1230338 RepID=L2F628_9GAMM|nr:dihydroneopterin aldolase [Moraxella macacae]ELA08360.1 dihydroneopterin aldolase [Moraxella macacae 0408225]
MLNNPMIDNHFDNDVVFIKGLKVEAVIGVYEWEQKITQPLIYDIEMYANQQQAAATDKIEHALNYKTVCERIAEVSLANKVALLERLAELVAQMILTEFATNKVTVTIYKPTAIKEADSVGVKITRYA